MRDYMQSVSDLTSKPIGYRLARGFNVDRYSDSDVEKPELRTLIDLSFWVSYFGPIEREEFSYPIRGRSLKPYCIPCLKCSRKVALIEGLCGKCAIKKEELDRMVRAMLC